MRYFKIYSKNTLRYNIALVVLSALLGLVSIELSKVIKTLFNVGILENNKTVFSNNILWFLIILVSIFLINFFSHILGYKVHWDGMKNVKMALFNKALKNNYNFFIENKGPEILSDINLVAFQVSKFCRSLVMFISRLIEAILFTYIVFKIDITACLVLVIIVPLASICNIWVNKKVSNVQKELIQGSRTYSNLNSEVFSSISNIKVKNKYDFFLKKLHNNLKSLHDASAKNIILVWYWDYMTALITSIVPMIVIYIMVFVSKNISIEIGEIIALYTVMPMMLLSYRNLFALTVEYSSANPSLKRMDYILDYDEDKLGDKKISSFESLEFKDVNVKYDNGKVVFIPNINIKNGDKVLVAGESGIGKSTMFDIILGIKKSYEGTVKINGINLKNIDIVSLRNVFGISFQENNVFNMSLEDNIKLHRASPVNFDEVVKTSMLKQLLNDKNDSNITNETISGGEKSRISIAQNIFSNPEVVLIDEALSSVDENIEKNIMESLLKDFSDKTFICISHRKSSAQYFNKVIKFS